MQVAVLSHPDSWYFKDLQRAAGAEHTLRCFSFRRLSARTGSGVGTEVVAEDALLSAYDAVLVRSMPPGSLEQVVFRMDLLGRLQASGAF